MKVLTTLVLLLIPALVYAQNEIPNSNFTVQFVDSQEVGYEAKLAIDNDPATMWASAWVASNPPFPHEIVLNLNNSYLLYGIGYLARQDGLSNGNVGRYEVFGSNDGMTFFPLSTGTFVNTMNLQMNTFPIPTYARFVKFRGLDVVPESPDLTTIVAAELKVYSFNGISFKVRPGEPWIASATHDGSCTVGYRLYANDVQISSAPVSSLSGNTIQLPGVLKDFGFYQIKISAYTMNMCNITADEKFSESVVLSVENTLSAPGIPTLSLPGIPMPPPIPPATPTAVPTGAQPKPRVFTIPPAPRK